MTLRGRKEQQSVSEKITARMKTRLLDNYKNNKFEILFYILK